VSLIEDIVDFPQSAVATKFLDARAKYFAAIRNEEKNLISQVADFTALKDLCFEYASTYRDLLIDLCNKIENQDASEASSFSDLKKFLAVDTVRVLITDFRSQQREAIIIGPTHPLRALWLVTWSQIAQLWVKETFDGPEGSFSLSPHFGEFVL
jgi:DNA phosphorothioation-dependent restriction protein DptH